MTRPTVRPGVPAKLPAQANDEVRRLSRTIKQVRDMLASEPQPPEEPKT
ncbi:hypothetical protein [Brevundimonas sp.]